MNLVKSIAASVVAASVTFAAQANEPQTPAKATPASHPVMLAFAFNDTIGRYDYKTERDCRLGAFEAYQGLLKEVGGDEKKMSGRYFCIHKDKGIVGLGAVTPEIMGRDIDVQKAYPNIKYLAPTYGFESKPIGFDPK